MQCPDFLVRVSCMTYNQAPYIEDALNGFCMQETSFPFVCTIFDDASTDGERDIIHTYLQKNFDLFSKDGFRREETEDYELVVARHNANDNCYFAVFFLKYNHWSAHKSKLPYLREWTISKYTAICEGDDYWTNPTKLQNQVSFLEEHEEYSMSCNRTKLLSVRQNRFVGEQYCIHKDNCLLTDDVIKKGGLYISTCSIVYKSQSLINYPDYCKNCKVGDYPLQMYLSLVGNVHYVDNIYSVYRVENKQSFMGGNAFDRDARKRMDLIQSIVNVYDGLANEYSLYRKVLSITKERYLVENYPNYTLDNWKQLSVAYYSCFKDDITGFTLYGKLLIFMLRHRIKGVGRLISLFYGREFFNTIKLYA